MWPFGSSQKNKKTSLLELKDDQGIFIGQPAIYPSELVQGFTKYFDSNDYVKKAYLAQIYIPDDGQPPHCLFAIQINESSSKNYEAVQADLAQIAKKFLKSGELIDFMKLQANVPADSPLKSFKVFYEK